MAFTIIQSSLLESSKYFIG